MRDTAGGAVPGVSVQASSTSLQGVRAVTTDREGRFRFPALPPGNYGVRAALAGFRSAEKSATEGPPLVSPDGKLVAAFGPDDKAHLFPVEDGSDATALPIPGAEPGQEAIRWCADGRCVFVIGEGWKVYRLDIRTGRRELWKGFSTDDRAQSYALPTPDGRSYVYGYYVYHSDLFLVDGVK